MFGELVDFAAVLDDTDAVAVVVLVGLNDMTVPQSATVMERMELCWMFFEVLVVGSLIAVAVVALGMNWHLRKVGDVASKEIELAAAAGYTVVEGHNYSLAAAYLCCNNFQYCLENLGAQMGSEGTCSEALYDEKFGSH